MKYLINNYMYYYEKYRNADTIKNYALMQVLKESREDTYNQIIDYYCNKKTLSEISEVYYISTSSLCHKFKRFKASVNAKFLEYIDLINDLRIDDFMQKESFTYLKERGFV